MRDPALDTLLDLHGSILDQGDGYWIKIEAWQVDVADSWPHGIRYSLTLHEPHGGRILGYDNAHALKPSRGFRHAGVVRPYDHRHRYSADRAVPYEFKSAQQLLEDFFTDVDDVLSKVKMP